MGSTFDHIFALLPDELRNSLNKHYHEIKLNYARGHYEPAELNGAKFSEIVYRILEWHTNSGTYIPLGQSISNFNQGLRKLENLSGYNNSIRFHIPDVLCALYRIRNKRGVAHVAGEIDSNHMDSTFVVASADWIMAELIRIFHNVSLTEAQSIVESLVTKQIPIIWEIGDHKRVISPPGMKLTTGNKVLLLLYASHPKSVSFSNLLSWTEYDLRNKARFRNTVLKDLHKDDLLHLDGATDEVHLSPLGINHVEQKLPLNF
jgi:hypothetical protein